MLALTAQVVDQTRRRVLDARGLRNVSPLSEHLVREAAVELQLMQYAPVRSVYAPFVALAFAHPLIP